jgi:hypothetical protein
VREVLDLGFQPPSNALLDRADQIEPTYPLGVVYCERCSLMQTSFDVPPEFLFNERYPYFSGQSAEWREHCRDFAVMARARFGLNIGSFVIEIGGNDGTLLKEFGFCSTLNIEPSRSVAEAARRAGVNTWIGAWEDYRDGRAADLVIANNVLAHTPRINEFVASIAFNLARGGVCTLEFPWLVTLLKECQFDTIYHEHYSYLSLTALMPLFERHGLAIFDVERLPTHGGSLRVYAAHRD